MERKLAAILAADVVGYSRLIGVDEAGTLTALSALLKGLVEPTLTRHRGRIAKLMGDGLLAEFSSVVDAVAAAVLSGKHTLGIIRADINDPQWWQRITQPDSSGRRLHVILQLPFIDGPVGGIPRDKAWVLAAFAPEASGDDITRVLVTDDSAQLSLHELSGDSSAIADWAAAKGYRMEQIHVLGFYPEAVHLSA